MKALCWFGRRDVRVEEVPDPEILKPHDIIVRVTSAAICGSDLHLFDGFVPGMKAGDVLGHEFMGEVVEVGGEVRGLRKYDRVVVPFAIACGHCWFCANDLWSLCDNTNPNADVVEKVYEHSPSGMFGYSHLFGGYAGGQAEYVRVPFGSVGALKVPDGMPDEEALFLGDLFPTGYQAVEQCGLRGGETVAIWGCGPVGQFAIRSAFMLGAARVIAIDRYPARLKMAAEAGADPLNYEVLDVLETLSEMTAGRGPDACIDAVGMEAHGTNIVALMDRAKQAVRLESDRPHALRQAIVACRKGGTVSVPGVYGGFIDKVPIGAAFNKGLTLKMGQTHVHRYMRPLLQRIERGEIDPRFVVTHRMKLDDAAHGYHLFAGDKDTCIKAVLKA